MKFWRVEFIISDRKNRGENRFLFQEESEFNQEKKTAPDTSTKRYIHPLRRAMKWKIMIDRDPNLNKTSLAKRLGVSRVWISQQLNLLRLPDWAQAKILKSNRVSSRTLLALNRIQKDDEFCASFTTVLEKKVSPQLGDKTGQE